jgi:hypothetical protein
MQLTHTHTWPAARAVPSPRVPVPAVRAAARPVSPCTDGTRLSLVEHATSALTTYASKGRFASLHGAPGRMAIPTNAHRRPPETPT